MALIFRLMRNFCEAGDLAEQPAEKSYRKFLREQGVQPPAEAEHQKLLRLFDEEIASVREEFAYAEKRNEERAEIEREACLVPEGETWNMLLRQEGALDRSIDRKVRILMRLRKESGNLPVAPAVQDDGASLDQTFESDSVWMNSPSAESAENKPGECSADLQVGIGADDRPADLKVSATLKLTERSGNVIENTERAAPGIADSALQIFRMPSVPPAFESSSVANGVSTPPRRSARHPSSSEEGSSVGQLPS